MRRQPQRSAWVSLVVITLLTSAFPTAGRAASCYQTAKAVDICSTATDDNSYVLNGAWYPSAVVVGSSAYMLLGSNSVVRVWDISEPLRPVGGSKFAPKWSFACEGNHTNLTLHVYPAATLEDFPFAFQPLSHWGWDWVSLGASPAFTATGYQPAAPVNERGELTYQWQPALFRHGTAVYLAGPALDATAAAAGDTTVYLYKVAEGNRSPANYTAVQMAGDRLALPTDGLNISGGNRPSVEMLVGERSVTGGFQRYLIIRSGSAAVVVDVTNPAMPVKVANWSGGDARLWEGDWAFDTDRWRIVVANTSATSPAISLFNISENGSPVYAATVALPSVVAGPKHLAVAGDLAVVGGEEAVDFINLGTSPPQALEPVAGVNTLTRICTLESYGGDSCFDLAAMVKDGVHYAIRALVASGDVVRIDPSCISTVPAPKMSVTGGDPAADCSGNGSKGFPGDTFTITDISGGIYESAYLRIIQPNQQRLLPDPTLAPHGSYQLMNTVPGTYTVDIVLGPGGPYDSATEDPPTTQTITICDDPRADADVIKVGGVACPGGSCDTWLQGDQLTVSAASSEGNPTGYDWFIVPQSGGINGVERTGLEASFPLTETGNYHVFLVSHYNHSKTDDVGRCAGYDDSFVQSWVSQKTTFATANTYDSCYYLGPLSSQPFNTGSEVDVLQGGVVPQVYLRADPIVAEFDYKVSTSPWAATFTWELLDAAGALFDSTETTSGPACTTGCTTSWTFAGGTLPVGTYTVKVYGVASDGTDFLLTSPVPPAEKQFLVQDCTSPSAPSSPSPSSGASNQEYSSVTLAWGSSGGNPAATYDVYFGRGGIFGAPVITCENVVDADRQCTVSNLIQGVSYTWYVKAKNLCAPGGVQGPDWTFTTKQDAPPPPPPPTCTTPSISTISISPSSPVSGAAITLTAIGSNLSGAVVNWSVTTIGGVPIQVASANGNPGVVTIANPATYSVRVTASTGSSCTTEKSTTMTVAQGSTCTPPTVVSVAVDPATPAAGVPATLSAVVAGATGSTTYAWNFKTAGGIPIAVGSASGNPTVFTFPSVGSYTAEVVATTDGCASPAYSRTITVTDQCDKEVAPTAAFTFLPSSPRVGQTVSFTDGSINGATAWSWKFGDGPSSVSTVQNPTHAYQSTGTFTVELTASNCKGSNKTTAQLTVLPECPETEAPVASIDWQEKGTFEFHGQTYNQPYVGQTIHLLGSGTHNPTTYNWYDFGDGGAATTLQNPTHVWTTPGLKNLRMRAKNCFGESGEAFAQIQVYSDSRPVVPTFDISAGGAQALAPGEPGDPSAGYATGSLLTFTASTGFDAGDPTTFVWEFGDDSEPVEGNPVTHVYTCRGLYTVTLSAGRHKVPGDVSSPIVWGSVSAPLQIDGDYCGPESVIAAGAAKVPGFNGTSWRTDMHIFNASESNTEVRLGILPAGQSNPNPFEFGPYTLGPKSTLVLRDLLGVFNSLPGVSQDYTKAAIRIMYENDEDEPPVVMQRTYTDVVGGGTYGQFIPGVQVLKEPSPSTIWLTGLRNTGLESGFRTNVGLTHLKGTVGDVKGIQLSLIDASGVVRSTKAIDLAPYGFLQESLVNLFGSEAEQIGPASLKVVLPAGAQVLTYYSEIDNLTGDPFLVTGASTPEGKVLIPGVARLAGEAGTLWRTDVQLTNSDTEAHTWELKFFPKGDVPVVSKALSVEPGQSFLIEDAVHWIYQPFETPDASGVLCVLPLEASDAMPSVSARTYNLTPSGTYGQSIVPLDRARGATAGGTFSRMYLTGMSTEDIARTNLGFVNLGTSTVNFDVYFYDRDGDLLNPEGAPYTFALGVNGWDQDKLENRFRNFFGEELPANQEALSAVVVIKSGGPGFAYASVIDAVTGDPMLVPAQLAP